MYPPRLLCFSIHPSPILLLLATKLTLLRHRLLHFCRCTSFIRFYSACYPILGLLQLFCWPKLVLLAASVFELRLLISQSRRLGLLFVAALAPLRSKSMRILFHWYFYPRCCCSSFLHPPNLQSHFLLNSGLVVLVACLCTDAFVWLLAYEISLISICTAFSLEGSAYRRTFAFGIMLVLSLISTSMFLLALSNCSSSAGSANSLGHTDVAISLNWLC